MMPLPGWDWERLARISNCGVAESDDRLIEPHHAPTTWKQCASCARSARGTAGGSVAWAGASRPVQLPLGIGHRCHLVLFDVAGGCRGEEDAPGGRGVEATASSPRALCALVSISTRTLARPSRRAFKAEAAAGGCDRSHPRA
ncbi:hypothetical protein SEVIR_1G309401v4 [Setaria viridis]